MARAALSPWARFAITVVAGFSVGAGAYLGSAQLARSTPDRTRRTATMRVGDVAVFGRLRCVAKTESRRHAITRGPSYLHCSKRPLDDARYLVDIFPTAAVVFQASDSTVLYATPR